MIDPPGAQRLHERAGYVVLAPELGEGGGAVLAVKGQAGRTLVFGLG